MKDLAKERGCYETFRLVVAGVKREKTSSRDQTTKSSIMAARQAECFENKNFGKMPPDIKIN